MLKKNSHCSFCGHAFADDAAWPRTCSQCKNTSYINPLPVAVTVLPVQIATGIGVLCVRRTIEPRRGQLALPGGYIEMGESWQAACVRELHEETEIEIDAATITLFAAHSAPDGTVLIFGLAPVINQQQLAAFQETSEASERVILTEPIEIAFPLHSKVLRKFFEKE